MHYFSPHIPFFWVVFTFLVFGAIILARNLLKCSLLLEHVGLRDITLTHFWPMFHLWINQVVGLYIIVTLVENGLSLIYFNILPHIIEWPSVVVNECISWRSYTGSILARVTMLQLKSYSYKLSVPDFYLLFIPYIHTLFFH